LKVVFKGVRRDLAELCREHGIDRQTVLYRLNKGMSIEAALTPPRPYPKVSRPRRIVKIKEIKELHPRPGTERYNRLVRDGIEVLIDCRAVIEALDPTPRRKRILSEIRRWLRAAGWIY
tara:strand:- start:1445 stop:1801 length:357 start_codon:yes stop_codon:yes gene_type:complete